MHRSTVVANFVKHEANGVSFVGFAEGLRSHWLSSRPLDHLCITLCITLCMGDWSSYFSIVIECGCASRSASYARASANLPCAFLRRELKSLTYCSRLPRLMHCPFAVSLVDFFCEAAFVCKRAGGNVNNLPYF